MVWTDGELFRWRPGTRPAAREHRALFAEKQKETGQEVPGGRQNEHRVGVCVLSPHLGVVRIVVGLCSWGMAGGYSYESVPS